MGSKASYLILSALNISNAFMYLDNKQGLSWKLDFLILRNNIKCDWRTKGGWEELPHVRGQGQRLRVPGCDGAGTVKRSYPSSEVRGGGRECSQEELPHVQGQGRRPGGVIPRSRRAGCTGTGGPRGAIPRSRSGQVAVRRYPLSR